jgi:lysyl-tRNA synthetase class 2
MEVHAVDEYAVRREKLERVRAAGIDPYPGSSTRTHEIAAVHAMFEELSGAGSQVVVCGRLMAVRGHGGSVFADLVDATGKMQLHLKRDLVGVDAFALFTDALDRGDFVQASGTLFVTKMGEQSIEVREWKLLTKSLLPLPDKWHGMTDVELRYRKRYLDLLANPEVMRVFRLRSLIVQCVREFLNEEGFLEVETPILQTIASGAAARPFTTKHNALDLSLHLRIAPELYLKRLIVGGFEKVYELGRCFRNEGVSFQHNPEFTMLEFYWAYADYEDVMRLTERMMSALVSVATGGGTKVVRDGVELDFSAPYPRVKFYDVVREKTGIDLDECSTETLLKKAIKDIGLEIDFSGVVGYGELCDALYKKYVRPSIIQPTFVLDYPAEMIPLAKRRHDEPNKIATVQLLAMGMELTKAYNELNDPIDQEERFDEEVRKAGKGSEESFAKDADFIEALSYGMPPTCGFGMGIDRLCTILLGVHGIKEVMLFPTMRPESGEGVTGN